VKAAPPRADLLNAVCRFAGRLSQGGYNRFTIRELLAPWDRAYLCGMRFLAPFAVHAALRITGDDDLSTSRKNYVRLLEALRDDRVDLDRASSAENLALTLDDVLPREVA
jgi:hypothetical protein